MIREMNEERRRNIDNDYIHKGGGTILILINIHNNVRYGVGMCGITGSVKTWVNYDIVL